MQNIGIGANMINIIKKRNTSKNLLDLQKDLIKKGEFINTSVTVTKSENKIGQFLLDNNIRVLPGHMILDWEFDFKLFEYPILIEIDGGIHDCRDKRLRDYAKDAYAQQQGFRVLRFGNEDVKNRPLYIIEQIKYMINSINKSPREIWINEYTIIDKIKDWFRGLK